MNVLDLEPGARLTVSSVTVLSVIPIKTPSRHPQRYLVLFRVEESPEETLAWFTNLMADDLLVPGETFYLTGSVKRHGSHDGASQTEVVGVTLMKNDV